VSLKFEMLLIIYCLNSFDVAYEIFSGAVMNVKVRADERQNNRPKKQCVLRLVQNRRFFYKGGFCHFVSFSSKKLGA